MKDLLVEVVLTAFSFAAGVLIGIALSFYIGPGVSL